jgi:aryl-alcohol dehydrogenase-like predicted oxidoreductase
LIESSVEASLARLGLEFLDVLALHDPRVEDLYRDDVTEALQRVLVRGQARAIGVAGSPEAALAALERLGVRIVQLANNPFQPTMNRLRLSPLTASVDTVTHTVYGHEGFAERMAAVLARDCQVRDHAQALGYSPVPALAARQIMLDYAFASNLQGVVLLSMYKPVHIQAAVARAAGDGVPGAVIDLVGEIVLSHMGSGA